MLVATLDKIKWVQCGKLQALRVLSYEVLSVVVGNKMYAMHSMLTLILVGVSGSSFA